MLCSSPGCKLMQTSDVVPRGSASARGCLEADFYCLGLGLGLRVGALALVLVLRVGALALALSQDRDQDTNLQGKTQHSAESTQVNHCNRPTDRKSKVHLEFLAYFRENILLTCAFGATV